MTRPVQSPGLSAKLKRTALSGALAWTLLMGLAGGWHFVQEYESVPGGARSQESEAGETAMALGRWAFEATGYGVTWLLGLATIGIAARSMHRGIREREQAAESMRRLGMRLQTGIEQMPIAYILWDQNFRVVEWNPAAEAIFGYSRSEMLGRFAADYIVPEPARPLVQRVIESLLAGGEAGYSEAGNNVRKDGALISCDWYNTPLKDETEGVIAVLSMVIDVTERNRKEEEVKRLSVAMEQMGEAVCITDSEATIEYVNPAFEQTTGYKRAEVIGQNPRILRSGEHDAAFYKQMWDTLLEGGVWAGQLVNKKKDGTFYTEKSVISPVLDYAGRTINYVAVKRDITRELGLEQQLRQAQKMESVGRLAGGVAHDFNNMLAVILGNVELAMESVEEDTSLHANLTETRSAAERSAALTRQLLAFARKQTVLPRVLDLNETVGGMLNMLRRLIGEDIDFVWLPGADVWPVKVDPSQIDQILANLCVNSRDAIEGAGRVVVETANVTLDGLFCGDHPGCAEGQYALLSVSDNGCGMAKEILDRLYEPFFTTKKTGVGTGLGLSTVYGIVKQNRGFIDVHSEREQGTTFNVYLPRHQSASKPVEKDEAPEPMERGGETILVVEDEAAILQLVTTLLLRQGYTVLAASTPAEAVGLASAQPGEIQLLLTDVVMPEMNGPGLAEELMAQYPNLKCLFMSGYTADAIANHTGILHEGVRFIQKPFTMTALATEVREALDG